MVQGSVRTERSISRKQNCSARNLRWPSIPKPSLADCHISMNYAFSSFLGRSSVSPGHQLLSRARYVVRLSCPIQFSLAVLFIYLFPIILFILPGQQRKAGSVRMSLCFSGMLSLERQGAYLSACRTETAQLCLGFPVIPPPQRSRSTKGPPCHSYPGATHLISHQLSPQII